MDLFQPTASGSLSSFMARHLFDAAKRIPRFLRYAGPLSIVVVITCWVFLIAIGFALVFWIGFPEGFRSPVPMPRGAGERFWTLLYFSIASLTTLAAGDLTAGATWIRLVSAIESVIGISLVTASATWIILIYPALGRMRSLSRRTSSLMRARKETGIDLFAGDIETLLGDLASEVIRVRIDLIYFPVIYYFRSETGHSSLASALLELTGLSAAASHEKRSEPVRLSSSLLNVALSDIAETLRTRSHSCGADKKPEAVFEAVRADHLERTPTGQNG